MQAVGETAPQALKEPALQGRPLSGSAGAGMRVAPVAAYLKLSEEGMLAGTAPDSSLLLTSLAPPRAERAARAGGTQGQSRCDCPAKGQPQQHTVQCSICHSGAASATVVQHLPQWCSICHSGAAPARLPLLSGYSADRDVHQRSLSDMEPECLQ